MGTAAWHKVAAGPKPRTASSLPRTPYKSHKLARNLRAWKATSTSTKATNTPHNLNGGHGPRGNAKSTPRGLSTEEPRATRPLRDKETAANPTHRNRDGG